VLYSEDSEVRCVLCTECTVRSVRHGVCCVRMYSEDSEALCVLCTECTVRTVRHSVCVVQ